MKSAVMGVNSCADVNQNIARHEVRGIPNMDAARDRLRPRRVARAQSLPFVARIAS